MKFSLREDLERFGRMAFVRAGDCTKIIEQFHRLARKAAEHPDHVLLGKVYAWVFVPRSIWPVDVKGLCEHLLERVEMGKRLDEKTRLLCSLLPEAPPEEVCEPIIQYEHAVKAGNYESLINAQFKFDLMEAELRRNEELKADWERIKQEFEVDKYRNRQGVIRRRFVQERNFRPSDWGFAWESEEERFRNVFDAFCHKWNLYGMEGRKGPNNKLQAPEKLQTSSSKLQRSDDVWGDKPLLLKLSVNLTPFGTLIEVPKYWSFDPKRDLKWGAVTELHKMREVKRQGPKLSPGVTARRAEAAEARRLWVEATKAGMKGDARNQWVMERLGWDARTDESRLRRILKAEG